MMKKIKIISERRTTTPVPSPRGGWMCSTYYAVKKCIIDGEEVHINNAEIQRYGEVEPYYGRKLRPQTRKIKLILQMMNGETRIYDVKTFHEDEKDNIRKLEIEVDDNGEDD